MALSFEESKKILMQQEATPMMMANTPRVVSLSDDSEPIAAYSVDTLTRHDGYAWFEDYYDDKISTVDENKNIVVHDAQVNISQEANSQFIPFEMMRYYDGIDITKMVLSFHFVSSDGKHGSSKPVNVEFNDEKIRLVWLVDGNATHVSGNLKFEIHADGAISDTKGNTYGYRWKSKSTDKFNIVKSICEDKDCDEVHLDEDWLNALVEDVAQSVADKVAEAGVDQQVTRAEDAAEKAEQAVKDAQGAVQAELSNYYTSSQVDEKLQNVTVDLTSYATEKYVKDQIDAIPDVDLTGYALKNDIPKNVSELNNDANYLTEHQDLSGYATKDDVVQAVNSIDIKDKLQDYALKSETPTLVSSYKEEIGYLTAENIEGLATEQYVTDAIAAADLDSYYKKEETYNKTEIDGMIDNVDVDLSNYYTKEEVDNALSEVDVDLSDYYTKSEVDTKTGTIASSAETATAGVTSLSKTVTELQTTVNSIDTSPRLTYDVKYNDTEDADVGENVFAFYEITNEGKENESREIKQKFTIVGGGGGSSTSSTLKIGYITTSPLVVTVDDEAKIRYTFSGTDSSGDIVTEGNATWKVAGRVVATETITAGENEFDITDYLSIGSQKVNLTVVDDAGSLVSKNWTVQKIDVRIESTFNDKLTYPIAPVSFDYTPYGAIAKDVHFKLDGKEIGKETTSASGVPMAYMIPAQEHGAHLFEAYMTAVVNNNDIESNHIVKDIIWYDETSTDPVISTIYQDFTARQYDATNIEYTVYDPTTETPTVEIAVDGEVVSTPTLTQATNTYSFKTDVVGNHVITIACRDVVKTLKANITKLDIDVTPVTAGLAFDFNPSGKSNNDVDRVWTDGTVSMSVSDNFDWVNGGYQYDENGDQYFCIKAGTSAEIDYHLFADDAKKNGKEFKLVFKTANVAKPDATFLSCMDNTTGTNHIGIQMDVHEAFIYGQSGKLHLPYSEEDIIEFEFNISKNTEAVPMVMGYEDGVSTRPMVYDDSHSFTQDTAKIISLGSTDCDLHIYRFKVYNTSLTDRGILQNFIADARNAEEMIARYDRNQIYDENKNLDPDVLAEKCPWLRIIKIEAPYFTNHKDNKVPNTTVEYIYKNGTRPSDNWIATDAVHSGQGTSSNNYGASGRNLDIIVKRVKDKKTGLYLNENPIFTLSDNTQASKVSLTENSIPVNYFNVKVNIASSNNLTNAIMAKRYNEFNPYNRPFVREDESEISKIKDTMEFHNCVVFIKESDTNLSTHREFADNDWHFYAIGNIGDSKKTDSTRLTDKDDKYECCVEIMDVELPLSDFPTNTMYNAMSYEEDETTGEKTYIWAKNENLNILYEKIGDEYVLTQDTEVDLTKTYYVDILEHDDFSEDFTYGWRYIWEDGTDEQNEEVFNYCKQKWIEFYRFVTTSTDEEFKSRLGEYFVTDSALYYYLFTTRYCLVDNRAKNSFWHYSKTGEVDGEGNPIRKWDLCWGYDFDTALGLNNYGQQVYRYGLEDTDIDEKGEEVFRESDSNFFCRIRDLFKTELKSMYNVLDNAWSAESLIKDSDEWQAEFPEELWRIDIDRKYIRTYNSSFINGEGNAQFLTVMSNGRMKYHRRQWERSQEKYMASKYQSSVASSDNAVFRCGAPSGKLAVQPNYRLKLTPYAYMYLNVKYGTQSPIQLRAEPNVTYEIPFSGDKTDIIDVYSSSLIQDFGDLSACYIATADTSKASKVKRLIFGNETEGYDNPYFTTLTTGANYLLETLNIENISGLTQSLNLTVLNNLRELYAHGSNIGGVTFADGGRIEIAELPAINAINMKNLIYLTNLDVTSFDNLTTITVENCNTVDLVAILNRATKINRARIIGVDWSVQDTSLLERLYNMKGIDKNGYNTDQSVLTGKVHVAIIREQQLYEYRRVWPDLEITFNTMIEQYPVTFKNDDGSILEVQYVDKGEDATDPVSAGRIPTPTKESSVSTDFTYAGWDVSLDDIFSERVITATYTGTIRTYTVKYVSKGVTLQESSGLYGEYIEYTGVTPTYTLEESGYKYYLFNRWDKSGYIDGDKTINALFDVFEYNENSFDGKQLANLSNVEIYALSKLGVENTSMILEDGDPYSIRLGYDVDFDDIESKLIVDTKTVFDGTNHIDTGIDLFKEDREFVLAIDYEFSSNTEANSVLAQCFKSNGSSGFKLWYNNGVKFTWGTTLSSSTPGYVDCRDMIVIRHKAGSSTLDIYTSNLNYSNIINVNTLDTTKNTIIDSTLVLGCAKADDGAYESNALGSVHWCKVWYKDLGDKICRKLANWTHEIVDFEMCGQKRFYLTSDSNKRSTFSLLATHVLDRSRVYNSNGNSTGGWEESDLNKFLNSRTYHAMPDQTKLLLKQVTVQSSVGDGLKDVSTSECYITIPSIIELSSAGTYNVEPYISEMAISSGKTISYMVNNGDRRRTYKNGNSTIYWTRSPNAAYSRYVYTIDSNGTPDGYKYSNGSYGVLIEISF